MFLNKKRLLLTLYRLEEGQQEIMERLERMGHTSSTACGGPPSPEGEGSAFPSRGRWHGEAVTDEVANADADKWIIDGIEAILSYRRDKEVKQ